MFIRACTVFIVRKRCVHVYAEKLPDFPIKIKCVQVYADKHPVSLLR